MLNTAVNIELLNTFNDILGWTRVIRFILDKRKRHANNTNDWSSPDDLFVITHFRRQNCEQRNLTTNTKVGAHICKTVVSSRVK